MKKKIVAIALVACLLLAVAAGATLAYFTDEDQQTNTFVAGKVGINLDECKVAADERDNLVSTGERTEANQSYDLHPGIVVDKDPTITVDGDSLDAYVAAVITIKGDLFDLIGIADYGTINIHALASGGLLAEGSQAGSYGDYEGLFVYQTENFAIHQVGDKENKTWTMYVFMKEAMSAGESVVLFEQLSIPAEYNNAEMAKINGMSIDVKAYAAQTKGFLSCYEAMTAAFGEDFNF